MFLLKTLITYDSKILKISFLQVANFHRKSNVQWEI